MSPDDVFVRPAADWTPRLMVIDGCNIGRSSCGQTRDSVSCAGLLSVVRWLLLRDFECVIFLPVVYNNSTNANASHVHLLSKVEELGLVTFTPARASSGDRRAFINYDDLYLTTLATRHGGCILSGDKFKDILAHPSYSDFHDVITNRVIDIRFLFLTHDVVHFGDDIFFRAAPELFIPEDVSKRARIIAERIHCHADDPLHARVQSRRASFTASRRKKCLAACDDLIYEICEREGIRPLRLNSLPAFQPRYQDKDVEEVELPLPQLEELRIVCDDSVWLPGDCVTMRRMDYYESEFMPAQMEPEVAEEKDMPLIDLSEAPLLPNQMDDRISSLPPSLDPFDLVEQQLMSSAPEDEEEEEQLISSHELAGTLDIDLIDFDIVLDSPPPTSPTVCPPPANTPVTGDGVEETQKMLDQLSSVFPRDVVETVLAMNASRNVDFLAEQCLLLLNQ